ncbi:MAG TPA: glycosyltransferase family 87 protein [Candidatus Limnocylindrales bacterium]
MTSSRRGDSTDPGASPRPRVTAFTDGVVALAQHGRVGPLADDGRWIVPFALIAYVLGTTWSWEFPDYHGIPFPPIWLALACGSLIAWRVRRGAIGPIAAAAIVAVTAMLMTDVASVWTQGIRDIEIYLKAGVRWLDGAPVYMRVPLGVAPADLSNYPFLYPPVTLPLFGALGALPEPLAVGIWLTASLGALLAGLRWVGLRWRWCLLLLLWPPIVQGLWVGNVAVPLFAFFAIAPWRPGALAVGPIFKVYSGLASLWLLRREHWRELAAAVVAVAAITAASLLIVDVRLWSDWLTGLQVYQESQRLLPNLYGFGLARYMPFVVFAAIAAVVLILALRAAGRRDQLGRLGVATVVGSPSLFSHGFLVALPAMFRLDTAWFWLAFGITACAPGPAWFGALVIVVASWFVPAMRKRDAADDWHPLGAAPRPWPNAPRRTVDAPPRTPDHRGDPDPEDVADPAPDRVAAAEASP